jgi:flagellar motor switch protein FliM
MNKYNTESKRIIPGPRQRSIPQLPNLDDNNPRRVKEYNFRNPDKFNKEHLKVIGNIHELFCREVTLSLNSMLRINCELNVANVQQVTYGDFLATMSEDLYTGILSMQPFLTQISFSIEKHLIGSMLDRLLGGMGVSSIRDELSEVEFGITKDILKRILYHLPEGWQTVVKNIGAVELNSLETSTTNIQIAPITDIVVIITINVEIGSYLGLITICIPHSALEGCINSLNRQSSYSTHHVDTNDTKEIIISKLASTSLPIRIVLARGELHLNDSMHLKVGDIVKLDTNNEDRAEIWIANQLKFLGVSGQVQGKLAVCISDQYNEDDV